MKIISVVDPICQEIVIEGITFFLTHYEDFVAIDQDGSVYAYRFKPTYCPSLGIWQPGYDQEYRKVGMVELEIGDSFDKLYQL